LLGADKVANIEAQMRALDIQAALNVADALKDLGDVQDYLKSFQENMEQMKKSMEQINVITKQVVGQDENGKDIYKTYDLNSLQDVFELFKDSKNTLDKSSDSLKTIFSTIQSGLKSGNLKIGDLLSGIANGSEGLAQWGAELGLSEEAITSELIPAVESLGSSFTGVIGIIGSITSLVVNIATKIYDTIHSLIEKKTELKIEKFHV